MVELIETLGDKIGDFIEDNWKLLIVFLIILLFFGGILFVIKQDVKKAEKEVKEESTNAIMETFEDVGDDLSSTIEDPVIRAEIRVLCWLLGIFLVIIILIIVARSFEPIYNVINPWHLARRATR